MPIMLLASLLSGCVVWFDSGASECGEPLTVGDGNPCVCDRECASSFCLTEESSGVPQGTCFRACSRDGECTQGAACSLEVCRQRCDTTEDCPIGRTCAEGLGSETAADNCTPMCQAGEECRSGNCNPWSGRCELPGEEPAGAGVAEPCVEDDDCRSGSCFDGGCLSDCRASGDACPDGAECVNLGIDYGFCLFSCTANRDCRDLGFDTCEPIGESGGAHCWVD